jgi:hypothetical protein
MVMENPIVGPDFKRLFVRIIMPASVGIALTCVAAGPYPEPLSNSGEIRRAQPTLDSIDIWNLPLADIPLLSKFQGLKRISLWSEEGTSATDAKLKALSDIGFTNLNYINLNNCRLITDKGIEALSHVRSLTQLTLEGTSITDQGCVIMASTMSLEMVNVANCPGVTVKGLDALARSTGLKYFSFSSDKLTHEEVLSLIDSFKNVKRCEVVDTEHKLDSAVISAKGKARGIHVSVRPTGALQEMKLYDGKL